MTFKDFIVKYKTPILVWLGIGVVFDLAVQGDFHIFQLGTYLNILLWPFLLIFGFFWKLVIMIVVLVLITFTVSLFVPQVKEYLFNIFPWMKPKL